MSELIAGRGATEIRVDGVDYTVNDPNIADEFATNKNYGIGDCCYYQGTLHKFNQIHEAGDWNGAHADASKVTEQIKEAEAQAGGAVTTAEAASYQADAAYQHADQAIQQVGTTMNLNLNSTMRIPAGSDLDNYMTPGSYHIQTFSDAGTIANIAEQNPCKLAVMYAGNNTGILQTFISASGNIYNRTHDGLGWHGWQRIGYWNGIIENTRNEFMDYMIVKFINSQLVLGKIYNTQMDSRSYISMSAVTMYYDEVDAVFTAETTVIGRNSITVTPTRDITAIMLKHNGATIDIGIKIGISIRAGQTYTVSYDMLSADPTTINGIVIENIQVEKGAAATPYIPGRSAVDSVARGEIVQGRWNGRLIVCFGDSRTWYDGQTYTDATKDEWKGRTCVGYQQTLKRLTGATILTQANSGETSADICARIRAFNFTGYDAAFLEGGVNDFVKSSQVTIGEIAPIGSTFDTSTVYGAWQSAVEYILTNYPQVRIFLDIPAIAWTSAGLFPYNIAKIKGEIAELYNLPCIDLYKGAGISVVNRDYFYCDNVSSTSWRLHFNDYGNALIGELLAGFINAN